MEFPLSYPGLENQKLTVRSANLVTRPQLLQNGFPLDRQKGVYFIRNRNGTTFLIRLRQGVPDPVPTVIVNATVVELARPFNRFEQAWITCPMLFLVTMDGIIGSAMDGTIGSTIGGAIGGATGGVALYANGMIFRKVKSPFARYAATAFILLLIVGAELLVILKLHLLAPHR